MPDVRLGEVTCPSGVLLLVDFGLLGLWSLLAAWEALRLPEVSEP